MNMRNNPTLHPFRYSLTFIWYLRSCVVGIYKITKHNGAMNAPLIVQNYTIFLSTSTQMTISEDVYCVYLSHYVWLFCKIFQQQMNVSAGSSVVLFVRNDMDVTEHDRLHISNITQ
jgi:hypothetical protein